MAFSAERGDAWAAGTAGLRADRWLAALAAALAVSILGSATVGTRTAAAAQLIDRNATHVTLAVDAKGEALVTYDAGGRFRRVLAWGAVNAMPPSAHTAQVAFRLDYAGGWGRYHSRYWATFVDVCARYDGQPLVDVVAACRAPDGSYWALQAWPQPLPDLGYEPWLPKQRATWLELSHWSGPLAQLTAYTDWTYGGRFVQLFGTFSYDGKPVYGFGTTHLGAPTDGFGRLIYLDTHDSVYGPGWRRENAFVSHNPTGVFCYGFFRFDPSKGGYRHPPGQVSFRGPGVGDRYRLTAAGPGVTPNVSIVVDGLGRFDAADQADVDYQSRQTALLSSLGDQQCMSGHH